MPQEIQDILDSISDFWDGPVVQGGLRAIGLYIVILWLATAYWAFRDMQLRTANPILPYLAAGLIILFSPILFIFGVLAYKIVRPQEKIGEVYERTLAEEALLAEVEAVHSCPTCARRVNDEWIICPTCRTRLNRVCPNCSRLVGLDWSLCAWCGRDFERPLAAVEASYDQREPLPFNRREALPNPERDDEDGYDEYDDRPAVQPGASPARGSSAQAMSVATPPTVTQSTSYPVDGTRPPASDPARVRAGLGSVRRRQPETTSET
jgi:RNA polymerase subunit RPABC4/transcription elongation factor Spt4